MPGQYLNVLGSLGDIVGKKSMVKCNLIWHLVKWTKEKNEDREPVWESSSLLKERLIGLN